MSFLQKRESRKITKNTNNLSIFNWTSWSSHGITIRKLDSRFRENDKARNNILISLIFIFLLCSCNTKQNNTIPNLPLPTTWNNYSLAQNNNTSSKWWRQFNEPVLNNLIEESLTGSSDIELAIDLFRN
ncbi:MAG: hypothetical protein LN589_02650 [Rickettsia endosymbiont of Eriopis connexa]|nr:hypothetical protein [Rickettsia endosymbiont of Eriopis connexa]